MVIFLLVEVNTNGTFKAYAILKFLQFIMYLYSVCSLGWFLILHLLPLISASEKNSLTTQSKVGLLLLFILVLNLFHDRIYHNQFSSVQFSSVQSLSRVRLFATPWIAARQASLSITNSRSSLRLKSIELVMPSSHLILCRPLLFPPLIPPSIRDFQWVNSLHEVAKVLEFQL